MKPLFTLGILLAGLPPWAFGAESVKATAVFTVDTVRQTFSYEPGDRLDVRFRSWASQCSPRPNGPLFILMCPKVSPPDEQQARADQVDAVAVLFRDLEETVYLAGCPVLEDLSQRGEASSEEERAEPEPDESGLRLRDEAACGELEAGQTFSAEVEKDVIRIVSRGRQLSLTLLAVQPKVLALGDPRPPKVSDTPPSSRSQPIDASQLAPQPEPKWSPPPLKSVASNVAKPAAGEGLPRAKTSLRTGRFVLECSQGPAEVYVDAVYVGVCPVDLPLVAGPHSVTVRRVEMDDWFRDFRVVAGETARLKVDSK